MTLAAIIVEDLSANSLILLPITHLPYTTKLHLGAMLRPNVNKKVVIWHPFTM